MPLPPTRLSSEKAEDRFAKTNAEGFTDSGVHGQSTLGD
jgi:hypothetical protein